MLTARFRIMYIPVIRNLLNLLPRGGEVGTGSSWLVEVVWTSNCDLWESYSRAEGDDHQAVHDDSDWYSKDRQVNHQHRLGERRGKLTCRELESLREGGLDVKSSRGEEVS